MEILLCNEFDDAIVAYIVKKWKDVSNIALGKTILQKLCYFIKAKGVPLSYDFDMYHYGPYSQNLYFRMDDMIADRVVKDVNNGIQNIGSQYIPGDNTEELIEKYSEKLDKYKKSIDDVLEAFKEFDHKDLELLSTIHFFHKTLTDFYNEQADKDEVIRKVKEAKGNKFNKIRISQSYDALNKAGIFNWAY